MIGYYVVILTAAMLLIVVVVRVFEAISRRKRRNEPTEPSEASNEPVGEADEELAAAAIGAVSLMLGAEKSNGVSAWSQIDRTLISPWKIASKSRRIPHGGR
jgi:hypothetical protein